jgi:hypothetical protein
MFISDAYSMKVPFFDGWDHRVSQFSSKKLHIALKENFTILL